MTSTEEPVVIVGAGHGGSSLCAMLRQVGYAGQVTVIGGEPHLPYHRPPLSKKFAGPEVRQLIRPPEFYPDNAIDIRTGVHATVIHRRTREVELDDGFRLPYGHLILATGARPRALPVEGREADNVLTLRTLDDAHILGRTLMAGARLAVVGGGYVGMEVAAVARTQGVDVTVIEREDRILARVASRDLSHRMTEYHKAHGTTVMVGADVASIDVAAGSARGVRLHDGRVVDCDLVLVGIGAIPDDSLAVAAGISCRNGIIVDRDGRTSDPQIFAIGDVALRPLAGRIDLIRLESIPNATELAKRTTLAIVGNAAPKEEVPWFWSDQFDLKLKIAGLTEPDVEIVVRDGKTPGSFALFHVRPDHTIAAVEAANAPAEFMAGKQLIERGTTIAIDKLTDPATSLRDVATERPVAV